MGAGGWKDEKELDRMTRFWMEVRASNVGFVDGWRGARAHSNLSNPRAHTQLMTKYRGVIMVLVVLPLSFISECLWEAREWVYRTFQVTFHLDKVSIE